MRENILPVTAPPVGTEWSLELLRGLAAIMVVLTHYITLAGLNHWLLSFMLTGVDLFFVISGFVFAPYFFSKKIEAFPFFIRRAFRIYPLYLVAIIIYTAIRYLHGQGGGYFLMHLFFLHTTGSTEVATSLNGAFWTLPPEVEFYLLLPLLCLWAGGPRYVYWLLLCSLAGHFLLRFFFPLTPGLTNLQGINFINVHLPGVLIEFMCGVLAYLVAKRHQEPRLRALLMLGGVMLWLLLAYAYSRWDGPSIMVNFLRLHAWTFAALAFLLVTAGWVGWLQRPPAWLYRVSMFLGNISFGVYLFHNAFPLILRGSMAESSPKIFALICFLSTLAFSFLMHLICEAPLRSYGRQLAASYQKTTLSPA